PRPGRFLLPLSDERRFAEDECPLECLPPLVRVSAELRDDSECLVCLPESHLVRQNDALVIVHQQRSQCRCHRVLLVLVTLTKRELWDEGFDTLGRDDHEPASS